ncbi:hypothetical protein [Streptomyces sp. NPDC059631]|uniref:hypothetical protein n=1 Tax=unclassified Streptomyces TaxID=2593676 RepID=UPI003695969D
MSVTMKNFALLWTDPAGVPRASRVSYDDASAKRREEELLASGASRVEIVAVKPGELPEPRA